MQHYCRVCVCVCALLENCVCFAVAYVHLFERRKTEEIIVCFCCFRWTLVECETCFNSYSLRHTDAVHLIRTRIQSTSHTHSHTNRSAQTTTNNNYRFSTVFCYCCFCLLRRHQLWHPRHIHTHTGTQTEATYKHVMERKGQREI